MARRREQMQIPGTEQPEEPVIPEVAEAIDRWLEAKDEQQRASEVTKIRHQTLLSELAEHGLERYPFIDERTGRKRYVVADKTPRAKTVNAPERRGRDLERDRDEPAERAEPDERVTHRRVPRASVEAEIAISAAALDPFGATRGLLDQARELQAQAAQGSDTAPAKRRRS